MTMGDLKLSPESVNRIREEAYTKDLMGPLGTYDLELNLDCKDKHVVQEYKNFDPKRLLKNLIDRATEQNISSDQFQEDIYQMLLLSSLSNKADKDIQQLSLLRAKYDVTVGGSDPDTVNLPRLRLMYPHYYVPLQKPRFSNTPEIPAFFQTSAFGGLIPTVKGKLKPESRKAIITVHLYCMHHVVTSVPLRTHHVLLKRKIETGLLSDERRIRFLENNDVLMAAGNLSAEMKKALNRVGVEFPQRILWNFFE